MLEIKSYKHLFACLWHLDHALHSLVCVRGSDFKGLSVKGKSDANAFRLHVTRVPSFAGRKFWYFVLRAALVSPATGSRYRGPESFARLISYLEGLKKVRFLAR